jgi:hypothetical protein
LDKPFFDAYSKAYAKAAGATRTGTGGTTYYTFIPIHLNQQILLIHLITQNQTNKPHIHILPILPVLQLITKHLLVIQV